MTASKQALTTVQPDAFSEAYYLQFKSSEERVAQLMCGIFTCYHDRSSGRTLYEVNADGDSILVYTITLGDPNKDGTWVYKESFMSSLPDKPLAQLFQRIQRISPDSLILYEYRPKDSQNDYIGYYKKDRKDRPISIQDLTSTGCQAGIKKLDQTSFRFTIDLCQRNKGSQEKWIDLIAVYTPDGGVLRSVEYDQALCSEDTKTGGSSLYYKRIALLP